MSLKIRFAKAKDSALILELIRELADYEKLSDQVSADETLLKKNLFSKRPMAEAILAYEQKTCVGFALFFHNFSTFLGKPGLYLEDLYVRPAYRGKGYGKKLMLFLATLAVERGCGRFEWWVLDWNQPSIDFYRSLGAVAMHDWTVYRLDGSALHALAAQASPAESLVDQP